MSMLFLKQLRPLLKPKCMRSDESDVSAFDIGSAEIDVSASNQIRALTFTYTEIESATNNFSSERASDRDWFGPVYEGTLPSGAKVTVKRLHPYGSSREFLTQILVLSGICHPRIVPLIGYCVERGERIVVYEYVEKGNLRDRLYIQNLASYSRRSRLSLKKRRKLSWVKRLQICIDSAEAIHYLHSGLDKKVIHGDVRSSNILVDENFRAKLTGFNFAKLSAYDIGEYFREEEGPLGYLDPEYYSTQQFTEKCDVYSFGMVLLEVLCATPAIKLSRLVDPRNFAEGGMLCHWNGELERIIDPVLVGNINSASFKKYCEAIELCLRENRDERPGMREVIWNLEMALESQLC